MLEASVFAIPHEKFQERPVALVVPREEFKKALTKHELIEYMKERVFCEAKKFFIKLC